MRIDYAFSAYRIKLFIRKSPFAANQMTKILQSMLNLCVRQKNKFINKNAHKFDLSQNIAN